MCRLAMISVHGCPLANLGGKETGGMNVYVRELALALGERSMSVDVYTRLTDPSLPRVVPFGPRARVIHLPAGKVERIDKNVVLDHLPEFIYYLRLFVAEHGPSYRLVHSHYWLSTWVGTLLARQWHVPHVAMYHTLGSIKNSSREGENESAQRIAIERRTMAAADAIVASSNHERTHMVGVCGAPRERISVVPCGVDRELFRPLNKEASRAELGITASKVIVFVGRIQPLKGIDVLLRALGQLGERHDYRLLVIGGKVDDDAELDNLRSLAKELRIGARVSFLGAQTQQNLPKYYSAADLCVVPSHYESFGLVALEALSCGTPVVAARVGGLPGVIRDGENGVLVNWPSPTSFAESIDAILSDRGLGQRLARAARQSVAHLTWGAVADQMLTIYDQVTATMPSATACLCVR